MTTGLFKTAHLTGLTTALSDRYRLKRELGAGSVTHAELSRRLDWSPRAPLACEVAQLILDCVEWPKCITPLDTAAAISKSNRTSM